MKYKNMWVLGKGVFGASLAGWGFYQLAGFAWTTLVVGMMLFVSAACQARKIDIESSR